MNFKKMGLFKRILIIAFGPFIVFSVVMPGTNFFMTRANFEKVLEQFQGSMQEMRKQTGEDFMRLSEQSAKDLLGEIKIATGDSLQPGESAKFAYLAKKQSELELVKEFSFYGPGGELELSSNPDTRQKTIAADVLREVKNSRKLVVRGTEESAPALCFYEPLIVDADRLRLNPSFRVGDCYGVLFVEFSKDRIRQNIAAQDKRIEESLARGRTTYTAAINWIQWVNVIVVLSFLGVMTVLLTTMASRMILKPISRASTLLRSVTERVSSASEEVAATADSLAQGSGQQASGLEETAASLDEIALMVNTNADHAKNATALADKARHTALLGNESMALMKSAIGDIQNSATQTARIIKIIDEIAFQTNLLALNAAVEAARAGDAGKGFAVVADEVRRLALRSAEAASDTSKLIAESMNNAQKGVDIAQRVGVVLDEIVEEVGQTTALVGQIASASREQAAGVAQVNQAVAQLDRVTQQNAVIAEQSASSAKELNAQSCQMNEIVGDLSALVYGAKS